MRPRSGTAWCGMRRCRVKAELRPLRPVHPSRSHSGGAMMAMTLMAAVPRRGSWIGGCLNSLCFTHLLSSLTLSQTTSPLLFSTIARSSFNRCFDERHPACLRFWRIQPHIATGLPQITALTGLNSGLKLDSVSYRTMRSHSSASHLVNRGAQKLIRE